VLKAIYYFLDLQPCTGNIGGYMVEQLVEALRYKSEDSGFDSRWRHWNSSLT